MFYILLIYRYVTHFSISIKPGFFMFLFLGSLVPWFLGSLVPWFLGQFFEDLLKTVVDVHKKHVHICGLDGDFRRQRFGTILDLIPYSDKVEKLGAFCGVCKDGTYAIFSHRVSNESEQVVIGSDNFMPLCKSCYNSESKSI